MFKILPTIHILSKLGMLFSLLTMVPTVVSHLYHDRAFPAFATTAVLTLGISFTGWLLTRRYQRELRPRDGFALVTMLWLGFAAIASIPFYLYFDHASYTDAFFEAMSGLTTTGATVITGLDTLAPSLNFWRHMLNWLGGMGIIVLAVAILPMLGVGGTQLFNAEIPGIDKDNKNKMAPRISQVAKRLWLLYVGFTLIIWLALHSAGMNWFDAACHAMSAISLGGFSTRDAGILYYDSPVIEGVLMLATVIGGINFANHFAALRNRTLRHYWRDEEARIMLLTLSGSIVVVSLYLYAVGFYGFWESFRFVSFNYVSVGLAGGFSNADFGAWPLVTSLWMFFLANILANTGSMGGGVKLARAIALAKFSLREGIMLQHPNAVRVVKVNGRSLTERTAMSIMAFIFVYFMTVVTFTIVMMMTGMDFLTALSAVIACITNAGPGLGEVGPAHSYADLHALQKWLCAVVMMLGRLEIFTVFILFTPDYWKK